MSDMCEFRKKEFVWISLREKELSVYKYNI